MRKINSKTNTLLLLSLILLPIFITFIPNVAADLTSPSQFTFSTGTAVEFQNPSLAISEKDLTVKFTYTWVSEEGVNEIYLGNNTSPRKDRDNYDIFGIPDSEDSFEEYIQITNDIAQDITRFNDYSQIAYEGTSGDTWVIYQGVVDGEGMDTEIFLYFENSTSQQVSRLTDNAVDDKYPTIVALDDSRAIIAWQQENSASNIDIIVQEMDELSVESTTTIDGSSSNPYTEPKLVTDGSLGSKSVHLTYIVNGNSIAYTNMTETGDISTLESNSISVVSGGSYDNISLDVDEEYVLIAYKNSGNIGIQMSQNGGSSFTISHDPVVTAGATPIEELTCYVTNCGLAEIIYSRTDSATQSTVYTANNFYNPGSWSSDIVMYGDTNNIRFTKPVVVHYQNTLIGVMTKQIYDGSWKPTYSYMFGYQLLYKISESVYSEFELNDEDPGENFLIKGLDIEYHSGINDIEVNVTYTDTLTQNTYSNLTTLENNGGNSDYIFFDPGNYMNTLDHPYDLTMKFESNSNNVIKLSFDPTILDVLNPWNYKSDYKLQSHYYSSGIDFPYRLKLEIDLDDDSILTLELEEPNGETLTSTNLAEFCEFQVTTNDVFNFNFDSNDENINAYIFANNKQKLIPSEAIYTFNHTDVGPSGSNSDITLYSNGSATFYLLVEKQEISDSVTFEIIYERYPQGCNLVSPSNSILYDWVTTRSVLLDWSHNSIDTDISNYTLQISNESTFATQENILEFYVEDSYYNFTTPIAEQWYFWRVKTTDTDNYTGPFSGSRKFGFDSVIPDAPQFTQYTDDQVFFTQKTFTIQWDIPDDGIYSVKYYNVYRSLEEDFTPDSSNMVSNEGFQSSNIFSDTVERNDRYYYIVEAIDYVYHNSSFSNTLEVIYSYGGSVDASEQEVGFQTLVGDIVEYEITWIQSSNLDEDNNQLMTFMDTEKTFTEGTKFHFWIKEMNIFEVNPVRGDWYSYSAGTSSKDPVYELEEVDRDLSMFVTNNNETYQEKVFNFTINQMQPDLVIGVDLNLTKYYSNWVDGTGSTKVVCYTYAEEPDEDRDQTTITFIVDVDTGILVEMIYYIRADPATNRDAYGFSINLVETTASLSESAWKWAPITIPIFILTVAGVIYAIMKKVEL